VTDSVSGETVTYQYDALKRLTTATSTVSTNNQGYQYDGFGNLTSKTRGSAATPIAVNAVTNRLSNAGYDFNGNMTSGAGVTLSYDVSNRVASAMTTNNGSQTEDYGYGPDNKRMWRQKADGAEEWTFYGAKGEKTGVYQLSDLSEAFNNQGVWQYDTRSFLTLRTSVWFDGRLVQENGAPVYADRLGTNRTGGAKYTSYGEEIGTATANDRTKFGTYSRDGFTGLDYADQRFYASTYGSFTSPDRFVNGDGPEHPDGWNRYAYVNGDPINYLDAHGTCGTPAETYTRADGTIGISVSIPCPSNGFAIPLDYREWWSQPKKMNSKDSDDDYRGAQPKCPSVVSTLGGLDAIQIQKNVDAAQRAFNGAVAMPDPEGTGAGVYAFLGYLTAQFEPGGEWDYKNRYGSGARNFGNFDFGAVLASLGASYYETQNAAGITQIAICALGKACGRGVPALVFPYGDQIEDAAQIKAGWNYQNKVLAGCRP
jgi:RHS repeat-associated protein